MRMLSPPELAGKFLKSFDFDAGDGKGYGVFTMNGNRAKQFRDARAVMEFWKTISKKKPLRSDGKANRPLSASTIEVVNLGALNHVH
jgi:hypothetical protein